MDKTITAQSSPWRGSPTLLRLWRNYLFNIHLFYQTVNGVSLEQGMLIIWNNNKNYFIKIKNGEFIIKRNRGISGTPSPAVLTGISRCHSATLPLLSPPTWCLPLFHACFCVCSLLSTHRLGRLFLPPQFTHASGQTMLRLKWDFFWISALSSSSEPVPVFKMRQTVL